MTSIISRINRKLLIHVILLSIIVVFAAWSRINTFWLPHTSGDEVHFIGLALKLDSLGLDGYNIRGVDYAEHSPDSIITLTEFTLSPEGDRGMLLDDMYRLGRGYYDNPLYYNTPGFPYLLMLSQKLLATDSAYRVSATHFPGGKSIQRDSTIFSAQFYATVWPYLFGILLVILTYFFGKMLFNGTTGLIAAFLMASNPISIFVSQKVWGDQISGAFVLLAAMLIVKGYRSKSYLWGAFAGIAAGLAYLLKETAGFFILGFVLFYLYDNRRALLRPAKKLSLIFNPFAMAMGLAFLAVTAVWFFKVYDVYGSFIQLSPGVGDAGIDDAFAKIKRSRPPCFLFYPVGIAYLSPLLPASLAVFSKKLRSKASVEKQWVFAFILCWIIAYYVSIGLVFSGQEHRYMIHIYPALAVMAAFALNELRNWAAVHTKHWKWLGADELMVILLIIFARWGLQGAFEIINQGAALFPRPF
jgi:hypothetical protein